MTDDELYEALKGMLLGEFEQVLRDIEAPLEHIKPDTVALSLRVNDVLQWTAAVPERRPRLVQAVEKVLAGIRASSNSCGHQTSGAGSRSARTRAAPMVGEPAPGALLREESIGMRLVWVPPGEFLMGSSMTPGEPGYDADAAEEETPPRRVRITRGFWMGQHPVTNAQYARFLSAMARRTPLFWRDSRFNRLLQPVVAVSYADAVAFCAWLSMSVADQGLRGGLPTEAEWEWAARGAECLRYPWGGAAPAPERAVFGLSFSAGRPAEIGVRAAGATALGIHDMAGNVWEWCRDAWRNRYPSMSSVDIDPCHDGDNASNLGDRADDDPVPRVVRGGCWLRPAGRLRCAFRSWNLPGHRRKIIGFRVVFRQVPEHGS